MSVGPRDLQREIRAALDNATLQASVPKATRLAAALRRQAVSGFRAYETARDRARAIKERAIEDLPKLVDQLEAAVHSAGGTVHRAVDAAAARRIITEIAAAEGVRSAVKSKSMTSEEIHLNAALEEAGIAVRETDLGEYIVQLDHDRPSHIIAPILHKSLEDVREIFRRSLDLEEVPEQPEELTQIARQQLRQEFLAADMGITGANFLIAESGSLVLVENEGNGRLSTQLPRIHVALSGIEKILPTFGDLEPFLQLLPRSATGQLMTSYLSIITGPAWGGSPLVDGERRFHLVLLDNGRSKMRDDPVLREALYCVRCGACLNVCPPYQAVGGHVFGGPTYQSGIGVAWEAGVRDLETAAGFADLCTTCSRCQDVCPVRIDIPWMNSTLRQRSRMDGSRRSGPGEALLAEPRRLYALARRTRALGWLNEIPPVRWALERLVGVDRRRSLPVLPKQTLCDQARRRGIPVVGTAEAPAAAVETGTGDAVVFWVDCHTDSVDVGAGRAAIDVLERLGFAVTMVSGSCCGRAALSQGDLGEARRQAREVARTLAPFADQDVPIVGLEPSCLTCVASDHAKLMPEEPQALLVGVGVRDIMQFLHEHRDRLEVALQERAGNNVEAGAEPGVAEGVPPEATAAATETAGDADAPPAPRRLVVHGHCQQKTAGWFPATLDVLAALPGVEATPTSAECCGMAGSFGYRTYGYEVSRELGHRLVGEIDELASLAGGAFDELVASGTSCRAQVADLDGRRVRHPIEIVARSLGIGDGGAS